MSFLFLLGILACCISAFVTVNRFGFALEGAWCAFDRIYYDALYGQLIENGERWEGLKNTKTILTNIVSFTSSISSINYNEEDFHCKGDECIPVKNFIASIKVLKDADAFELENDIPEETKFIQDVNSVILLDYFDKEANKLNSSLKILSMILFCLLLITVTAAGIAMMFYACLKRQGYLITFMHVLWNVIRFFIFSFFLYGTTYGIFFLILRDLIACMQKIFNDDLENDGFLHKCIFTNQTKFLDESIKFSVVNFFTTYNKYKLSKTETNPSNIQSDIIKIYNKVCTGNKLETCEELEKKVKDGNLGSFDCRFLKSDLYHLYKTLEDASVESRILSALSLSSAFFGAIAVYFYLLVIHHYNNELFFDSGKSIFTGFDGFGRGFQKKNRNQDPAYKKRKLRAEIELTSKNEDENIED